MSEGEQYMMKMKRADTQREFVASRHRPSSNCIEA